MDFILLHTPELESGGYPPLAPECDGTLPAEFDPRHGLSLS